jgi:hypothetical protein
MAQNLRSSLRILNESPECHWLNSKIGTVASSSRIAAPTAQELAGRLAGGKAPGLVGLARRRGRDGLGDLAMAEGWGAQFIL